MKKFVLMIFAVLLSFEIGAQGAQEFLRVESVSVSPRKLTLKNFEEFFKNHPKTSCVLLSNGTELVAVPDREALVIYESRKVLDGEFCRLQTNFKYGMEPKVGDYFYRSPFYYWYEPVQYKGYKTIEEVSISKALGSYEISLDGDFSFNSFFEIVSNQCRASYIVSLTFTDGSSARVYSTTDPSWKAAKPRGKVEIYMVREAKLYKLL